jgi:5-methyltetrahydropteroyltriglutamate--homocysteine methyltransferase
MTSIRADHVGSLLRPTAVLDAHASFASGRLDAESVREIEDRAILEALELQRQVGLDVCTDGEYRRANWAGDFSTSVEGYVPGEPPIRFELQLPTELANPGGAPVEWVQQAGGTVIGRRLRQVRRLTEGEVTFLKRHAPMPFKVTLPAPSYIVARGWKPGITDRAYASRADLLAAVAGILSEEVRQLEADGVPYIQIDNPHWSDYIPAERRAAWRSIGIDPDQAIDEDIRGDNIAVACLDRARVKLATHICRGNGRSAWHTSGGYEPVAEKVFGQLDVDRFLLEYDSERAGGFEPLRFMPRDKQVVLGLVTTKMGALENQDDLLRRVDEASRYVPIERLAISPQCGFASVEEGNLLSLDDQRRKLELVVDTARKVWG